ncbi:MAG: 3D domain-containing protein [Chloroflexi bacterium]|nr:3D domain-containing protein [Chloroflexota bacterium]
MGDVVQASASEARQAAAALVKARRPRPQARPVWVAPHAETVLYAGPDPQSEEVAPLHQWAGLQVEGPSRGHRIPVLDPSRQLHGWVPAADVGPIDPSLLGTAYLPPIGRPIAWAGPARVTMYTCVELGGCAPTASGLWPEPGMVAVDPSVIPLGSTVWIQGVGTFLATDTGSLVRGAHLDIYSLSYQEALNWGVQQRSILVFDR